MYSTDEKVKDFMTVPDTIASTEIKQYIKAVSKFMDNEVGYKLGWVTGDGVKVLTFDGSGTDVIDFGKYWLNSMGIIEQDGTDITAEVLAYPMNEDYKHQIVMKSGVFCDTPGGISIADAQVGAYVVDWKESAHTFPDDLAHACTILVCSIIRLKLAGGVQSAGKVSSEKTSAYAITFSDGIAGEQGPDEVTALSTIAFYKDHFIA